MSIDQTVQAIVDERVRRLEERIAVLETLANASQIISRLSPDHALHVVAAAYGVPVAKVIGSSRKSEVATARQAAAWLLVEVCGLTYANAGSILRRDHSTIQYSVRRASEWRGTNAARLLDAAKLLRGEPAIVMAA